MVSFAVVAAAIVTTAFNPTALKALLKQRQSAAARASVEEELAQVPASSPSSFPSINDLNGSWQLVWSSQTADVNPFATPDSVLGGKCIQEIALAEDGCGRLDNVVQWAPRWRLVGSAAVEPANVAGTGP